VHTVLVDYTDKDALVAALTGQDALIITLSPFAPKDTHALLVEAAATAGVPWILPNHWAHDTTDEIDPTLTKDVPVFAEQVGRFKHIASLGVSAYVDVATGFWYELLLQTPGGFGFDFAAKKASFLDDGKTQMTVSSYPQIGRVVASLLSLPVASEGSGPSLEDYRNKEVYMGSFTVSQSDMFESVLRVTGQKREEWTIEHEPSKEKYRKGFEAFQKGDMMGFMRMLTARVFYPEHAVGNMEKNHGLVNKALEVPLEDLDTVTRTVV